MMFQYKSGHNLLPNTSELENTGREYCVCVCVCARALVHDCARLRYAVLPNKQTEGTNFA
jgi:hypothetical protein